MALAVGINSYLSYEEANEYMADRLFAEIWGTSSHILSEKALIMATKRIDSLPLRGQKLDLAQTLHFPITITVPQAVKDAVCEEALVILEGIDKRAKLQAAGVTSTSFSGISESYNTMGYAFVGLQSLESRRLLEPWLGVIEID